MAAASTTGMAAASATGMAAASSTGLLFNDTDLSPSAAAWRRRQDVQDARAFLSRPTYAHGDRLIRLLDRVISAADVAFAFEVGLGPVKHPVVIPAGIGVSWYGVQTEQSVTDSATLHELLWRIRPGLLVEVGTMCGSSAVFLAKTMMGYDSRAKVITFDLKPPQERGAKCSAPSQGFGSAWWAPLQASGNLLPIIGEATSEAHLAMLRAAAADAQHVGRGGVFVIDDASHVAPPTVDRFRALSPLVTRGSYYLIEDTRLDSDCALSFLTMPPGSVYWYCRRIQKLGGPAVAVANITRSASFRQGWTQDRAVERWVITQHPGGYLRRTAGPRPAPARVKPARRRAAPPGA